MIYYDFYYKDLLTLYKLRYFKIHRNQFVSYKENILYRYHSWSTFTPEGLQTFIGYMTVSIK